MSKHYANAFPSGKSFELGGRGGGLSCGNIFMVRWHLTSYLNNKLIIYFFKA